MKTTLFLSSIFFLLGLWISNLVDLRGKANAVDQIIVNTIINSKPVKAIPLFQDTDKETKVADEKTVEEPVQKDNETQVTSESNQ